MPSDDVILNLRQIAQYPGEDQVAPSDLVLVQKGGLGGPYASVSAQALVSSALSQGGVLAAASVNAGTANVSVLNAQTFDAANGWVGVLSGTAANFSDLSVAGRPVASTDYVDMSIGGIRSSSVWSFNGRTGDIMLNLSDVRAAGGAPLASPSFTGMPLAPTPSQSSYNTQIATTQFVWDAIGSALDSFTASGQFVSSFNGRTGAVTLTADDIAQAGGIAGWAPLDSPAFTGTPTAPTPPSQDDSQRLATTAWVVNEVTAVLGAGFAPINSPNFSGVPTAPTASPGSSTGQLATTAFVQAAVTAATAGVASFNTRTGAVVLTGADVSAAGGALLASPAFTGTPQAPTAAPGNSSQQIATTAFVAAALGGSLVNSFNGRSGAVTLTLADITGAGGAPNASPVLTGNPQAPTAATADSSTSIATTAFVHAALAASTAGVTAFNGRTGSVTLLANDVSGVGGALTASPAFTGTPSAPTAAPGTNTTQIATCAFVEAAVAASGVTSFNARTGAITLQGADITAAGGALTASPSFSGTPTAPTAAQGTNSLQLATTAFVATAIAGAVASFNGRTGIVTLQLADITGAGGAPLASPSFSGVPLAPTATAGTSNQQIATTAFVAAALTAANVVTTFNGRQGAVTLQANDLSAVGGALLAGPAFTGVPTAPTAGAGTNTNQIATCAFVESAIGAVGAVLSWNGRSGAVTMTAADVSGVGGALLTGAGFTGPVSITGNTPQLSITAGAGSSAYFPMSAAAGMPRQIMGSTAGVYRWALNLGDGAAESGSNAGSNFSLTRFNDAGSNIDNVLSIVRSTGAASFSGSLTSGGNASFSQSTNITAASLILGNSASATTTNLAIYGTVGGFRQIAGYAAGNARWSILLGDNTAEGGSNSGANFAINRYSDAGAAIDAPLSINRASGIVSAGTIAPTYLRQNAQNFNFAYNNPNMQIGINGVAYNLVMSTAVSPFNNLTYMTAMNVSGGTIGMWTSGAGGQWAATMSSDRALKRNLKAPDRDALAALNAIPVYQCDMKQPWGDEAPEQHWDWAVIADEAKPRVPLAIEDGNEAFPHATVREWPMICALIRAVQQLTARIAALEEAAA